MRLDCITEVVSATFFFSCLLLFLVYPVCSILNLAYGNVALLWQEPGLMSACLHSLYIASLSAILTCFLAFVPAWVATHTRVPCRNVLHTMTLLPLCMPSMLPAIGLIYLFGPQGCVPWLTLGQSIYGPIGLVMGNVLFCTPHAAMLLKNSLASINPELYQAATSLGAGPVRRLLTITLPSAKRGIFSAFLVSFALSLADFGVPKVMAGNYAMLPTEIYAKVIGQHDLATGSALCLALLLPVCLVTVLNQLNGSNHTQKSGAPYIPQIHKGRDTVFGILGLIVVFPLVSVCAVVVFASFASFWPYDMSLCLDNYAFSSNGYSVSPIFSSITLAFSVACFGTALLFAGAWLFSRCYMPTFFGQIYGLLLQIPLALPGTLLGIAYIFTFNNQGMAGLLYGTFFIAVANTIVHLAPAVHLASVTAIVKLDDRLEATGLVLGVPRVITFFRVIVPSCRQQMTDMFLYLFINALTTVSAVVFLCNADTSFASVSILQMYDSGNLGSAAAMGSLIAGVAFLATILFFIVDYCRKRS